MENEIRRRLAIDEVIHKENELLPYVTQAFSLTIPEYREAGRTKREPFVLVRMSLMWVLSRYYRYKLVYVGCALGEVSGDKKFDHSTVIHAGNSIPNFMKSDFNIRRSCLSVLESIRDHDSTLTGVNRLKLDMDIRKFKA